MATNDQQKPFDTVSIVVLILVGLANDAAQIICDLLVATVVGLPSEAIMEPINFLIDGGVTTFFIFKAGFGWPTIIQFISDVLEVFGIPGRTISLLLGIYLVNHPNSRISQVAQAATKIDSLSEEGIAGSETSARGIGTAIENDTATEANVMTEGETEATSEISSKKSKQNSSRGSSTAEEEESEPSENLKEEGRREELDRELGGEEQENPMDVQERRLLEEPVRETGFSKVQDISSGRGQAAKENQDDENQHDFGRQEAA